MAALHKRLRLTACAVAMFVAALISGMAIDAPVGLADEIRLKDGKKLYGSIVGYDDNMFKVKTDFGFVLVEKDKIASIIPTAPAPAAAKIKTPPVAKRESSPQSAAAPANPETRGNEPEAATTSSVPPALGDNPGGVRPIAKRQKSAVSSLGPAPKLSSPRAAPSPVKVTATTPLPPKEPEVIPNREDVQGNFYTNYTHAFRIYKAPSWKLIEGARKALPNAIVAMGTSEESTLMVIGKEKTGGPLDAAAATVERRLREVYENYRHISQAKTVVGGLPAVEYRFHGLADEHDWSGTLVVIARGGEIFTVLGMTYGESDLIQIQENVIARAIASLDFDAH